MSAMRRAGAAVEEHETPLAELRTDG